jgi:hypothetical protein
LKEMMRLLIQLIFRSAAVACGMIGPLVCVGMTLEAAEPELEIIRVECRILPFIGNVHGLSEADLMAGKKYQRPKLEQLYYAVGFGEAREYQPIRIRANKLSRSFVYSGVAPFQLFAERRVGEQEDAMVPVVSVSAAKLVSNSIFLVLNQTDDGGYTHILADGSAQAVPNAHVLLLNLSEFPVAATTGENPLVVAAATSGVFPMSSLDQNRFDLKLAIGEPEGWKRIYSSKVVVANQNPILTLVHRASGDSGSSGDWTIRFIEL